MVTFTVYPNAIGTRKAGLDKEMCRKSFEPNEWEWESFRKLYFEIC